MADTFSTGGMIKTRGGGPDHCGPFWVPEDSAGDEKTAERNNPRVRNNTARLIDLS